MSVECDANNAVRTHDHKDILSFRLARGTPPLSLSLSLSLSQDHR